MHILFIIIVYAFRLEAIALSNKKLLVTSLLGARTLVVAPGLTASNKKLLGWRPSLPEAIASSFGMWKTSQTSGFRGPVHFGSPHRSGKVGPFLGFCFVVAASSFLFAVAMPFVPFVASCS